ncbi:MAG: DMT family transporter [Pseudomonadota bacterium]
MTGASHTVLHGVMLLAGLGIPVMAALNAGLGARLGNPAQAATLLFGLALAVSLIVLWLQPRPVSTELGTVPLRYFLGGILIAFYVMVITPIAPKIGVGNAVVFVLFGQLLASTLIDHFGWLSAPQSSFSAARCMGLVLIGLGAMLARGVVAET